MGSERILGFFFFSIGKPHYKADCITFNSKRRQGLTPEPYTFSFHHSQTDDCMIIVNRHHEWRPQFRPMLNCLESSNSRLSLFSYYCYHYHHHHHHHHQHHHRYHYLLYFNFWMKFAKERDCKKNKTKQKIHKMNDTKLFGHLRFNTTRHKQDDKTVAAYNSKCMLAGPDNKRKSLGARSCDYQIFWDG